MKVRGLDIDDSMDEKAELRVLILKEILRK
jgi:hypothetical protein